ncbi:HDOD domain-containing protein [Neptunomonas japonica]|uniref:Two-component system response regulator n=1 Tax=Neptunomonas japonica JAMM 1380 TaxID=1441457 RepID=A0A7R6PLG9_9GAMM|nr:HDOD domain-containing protein [Neptunomonas japonica]BBB30401.1 two-component system response regulator [Neptunomonas japonica JAMM 1380]
MSEPKVLFVDDENKVLRSLRRSMRLHCKDWKAEYCSSPKEALLLISTFDPWVVVSDKRMTEMDGAEFLHQVSQNSPGVIRVLLTGDTSPDVAIEVTNTAHMLIPKPFEFETLIQKLQRVQYLRMFPAFDIIRQRMGCMGQVSVLPKVYQKIVESMQHEGTSSQEVAKIISQDPAILAKLMQLANSAFLGFSQNVYSANDAVIRLGFELTKNVVLCLGIYKQNKTDNEPLRGKLFAEALEVAVITRQVSDACGCNSAELENSFVLGLLHNIGMLVPIIPAEHADPHGVPNLYEQSVIGAYLLSLWEFDNEFTNAVLYQNKPECSEVVTSLSCWLHVAKIVSQAQKQGVSALETQPALNQSMLQAEGLLDDVLVWINEYESKH